MPLHGENILCLCFGCGDQFLNLLIHAPSHLLAVAFGQGQFPAQTLAAQLYLDSGVRGMERGVVSAGRDPETGDHRYPALELTRLAIPRRVYTQAHMDVVAESIKAVFDNRMETQGMRMVYEPKYLRFFQARFEPLDE